MITCSIVLLVQVSYFKLSLFQIPEITVEKDTPKPEEGEDCDDKTPDVNEHETSDGTVDQTPPPGPDGEESSPVNHGLFFIFLFLKNEDCL